MGKLVSIRSKMLFSLITAFIVILAFSMGVSMQKTGRMSDDFGRGLMLEAAYHYANDIGEKMNEIDNLMLGLKIAFDHFELISLDERREYLDTVLRHVLENEMTDLLAVWACFEPNALDGLDSKYVNTKHSDATGRYVTYL